MVSIVVQVVPSVEPSINSEELTSVPLNLYQNEAAVIASVKSGVFTYLPVASSLIDGVAAPKFPAEVYTAVALLDQPAGIVGAVENPSVTLTAGPPEAVFLYTFNRYFVAPVAALQLAVKLLEVTSVAGEAANAPNTDSPPINLNVALSGAIAIADIGRFRLVPDQVVGI